MSFHLSQIDFGIDPARIKQNYRQQLDNAKNLSTSGSSKHASASKNPTLLEHSAIEEERERIANLDLEKVDQWRQGTPNLPHFAVPDFDALHKTGHSRKVRWRMINGVRVENTDEPASSSSMSFGSYGQSVNKPGCASPLTARSAAKKATITKEFDEGEGGRTPRIPEPKLMSFEKLTRRAKFDQKTRYEGKVCRFRALMNDCYTTMYERRLFLINYYLENDTLSVHEVASAEKKAGYSGREPQVWFRRGRMKKFAARDRVEPGLLQPLQDEDCVELRDFSVNAPIILNSQEFFIYDACAFTREFFKTHLNTELAVLETEHLEKVVQLDSPKAGRAEVAETEKPESATSNSNCKKAAKEQEEKPKPEPANRSPDELAKLLHRLIGKLRKAQKTLRETFRYFDAEKDHVLCLNDFKKLLTHYGYDLSKEDTGFLFRYFCSEKNENAASFSDFVAAVSGDKDVGGTGGAGDKKWYGEETEQPTII